MFVSGWGVISFLKLNLLLDWTTTRAARPRSAEFGMFLHWDLIGRERGTTNDASGSALAIHGSKTGSGDVVADSTRTQIAKTSSNNVVGG